MFFLVVIILVIVLIYSIYEINDYFRRNVTSEAYFITGCDSGFGKQLAERLVRDGATVFAGCLTDGGVDGLKNISSKLHPLKLDVTNQASVDAAVGIVENQLNGKDLTGLVNNAGVSGLSVCDDWLTVDDYQKCMDVNTFGPIRVTHSFMPLLKRSGNSRIVFMSSALGQSHMANSGAYAMSKRAVDAYADTVRMEYKAYGITVSVVQPGGFKTPMTESESLKINFAKRYASLSAEIKQEYGAEYLEQLTNFGIQRRKCLSGDTDQVVDCMHHALTAFWAQKRYYPGYYGKYRLTPMGYLPHFLADLWLTNGQANPTPREIRNENQKNK